MRRRLFLVLAVVCIAAVFAGVFAGCNNGDGKGEGAKIFNEGATLEEILTALEKADSFTYSEEYQEVGTYARQEYRRGYLVEYRLTKDAYFCMQSSTDELTGESSPEVFKAYTYRADGVNYDIGDGYPAVKSFAQYDSGKYDDVARMMGIYFISGLVAEDESDNIVVMTDDINSDIIEGTAYVRLNGSSIEIGWEENIYDEEGGYDSRATVKYTWSGVNATTIDIPADVRALEADAEWEDYVDYNEVEYRKATDADGNEYYEVYRVFEEGAVPEETINGLPVRERQ